MLSPEAAAAYESRTGYIPDTRGAVEHLERTGFIARIPNIGVAMAQLEHARPWPWSPLLFRVQREIVQPRLERAIFAAGDARALLADARALARRVD
jgi:sn-glycerol 3-phosphate transport system substrate-binding protein